MLRETDIKAVPKPAQQACGDQPDVPVPQESPIRELSRLQQSEALSEPNTELSIKVDPD